MQKRKGEKEGMSSKGDEKEANSQKAEKKRK